MFQITNERRVMWPVTVAIPRDGGKVVKSTFTAEFELVGQDEFDALYAGGGTDSDLLRRVWVGWGDDVQDVDGNPLAFSEEAREKLMTISYVRIAAAGAYMQAHTGREAPRKN